jgi:hypothetical protein
VIHLLSKAWVDRRFLTKRAVFESLCLSLLSCLGTLWFLIYCQIRFGAYNLYLETQRIGWGIVPDYSGIWKWSSFLFKFPFDRVTTLASGYLFIFLLIAEILIYWFSSRPTGVQKRAPIYITAFLIFFVTLSGLKNVHFLSMIRYSLPWYILLILCVAHLVTQLPKPHHSILQAAFALILVSSVSCICLFQIPYFRQFLSGKWFA